MTTDNTAPESASDDYPICEDECVTWGGHAENCRVPAAIRALEAKVREKDREIEVREADNREVIIDLRNHCNRLAGEVERLKRDVFLLGNPRHAEWLEIVNALLAACERNGGEG